MDEVGIFAHLSAWISVNVIKQCDIRSFVVSSERSSPYLNDTL